MVLVGEKQQTAVVSESATGMVGEVMAFCPTCKAFQTLWFTGGTLTPTRKFHQAGEFVYHDCNPEKPCRLYRVL